MVQDAAAQLSSPHDRRRQLIPVGEQLLPAKCKARTLAYCPTMDLIALATVDEELRVLRLNGQRVFGGSFSGGELSFGGDEDEDEKDNSGEIRGLVWKGDGHLLAVACGDGTIRIISSYSGKTVHHYPVYQLHDDDASAQPARQRAKVSCLGWGVNFTDGEAAQRHLHDASGRITIEDLLSPDTHISKATAYLKADLPRELALLDITSSLPKLSTLPGTGSDDDVFSSRASIDAIFHSTKNTSDSVDVLVVGFDDGTVHLRIFDCFEIGSVRIGTPVPQSCRILLHASHPLSSTHALLAAAPSQDGGQDVLHLLTLDLRFITNSGRYLSLLASKTTQLQNLLRYIGQVQRQIELEWKNTQELPTRYMRNINEDLQEKCNCDFVTALYHLVVTGDCFEPLKEFLVDIVGERGHKRWEKAVSAGYENIRRLAHECLLPALERSQVLLSRLTGLSKFQKLSDVLGLETSSLNAVVETLDCLYLLGHNILIHANEELGQFLAFSRWLRHEIEVQSAEPMSQTLEELMEKADTIEYPPTLKYIRGALTKSALRNFIQQLPMMGFGRPPPAPPSIIEKWALIGQDRSFFDMFSKLLAQQNKQGEKDQATPDDTTQSELPKLHELIRRLGLQFESVFEQIALTQRRGILHRSALTLHPDCDKDVIDITMCYEDNDKPCSIYVATRSIKSKEILFIYRATFNLVNGVSSTRQASVAPVSFQEGEIHQVQFVDDSTLMVLWSDNKGFFHLVNIPIFQSETTDSHLSPPLSINGLPNESCLLTSPQSATVLTTLDLVSPSAGSLRADLIKHTFPQSGPKSRPVRIEVNGHKSRRAVCVLYAEGLRYEVFDLDTEMGDEVEEG